MASNHETFTGQVWMLLAYDVGYSISLTHCRDLLAESNPQQLPPSRRSPVALGPEPRPLVWESTPFQVEILDRTFTMKPRAVIYDFGAVSISLTSEFSGSLEEWRDLSVAITEIGLLDHAVRKTLKFLLGQISPAIVKERIARINEDYFIFQLNPNPEFQINSWIEQNRLLLAQTLRGEPDLLAPEEIEESLRKVISYGPNDFVIVDWAAAVVMDANFQETLAVFDFVNVELLEMRFLDNRLDDMLEEAYRIIRSKKFPWRTFISPYGKPVRHLVELMADAAAEFESVNNAIKLTNDQYLARVYRLTAERFHLKAFEADISRKLDTLWDIHGVFIDRASARRQEVLEWIIIGLIAFEIFLYFEK